MIRAVGMGHVCSMACPKDCNRHEDAAMNQPLTIDAHVDTLWVLSGHAMRQSPPTVDSNRMQFGGLDKVTLALYLSDDLQDRLGDEHSWRAIQLQITSARMNFPAQYLALEGGRVLGKSEATRFTRLKQLADVRIKYLTLVHNHNNLLAGSATDPAKPEMGLTRAGVEIVEECEEHGVLVDLSHASDRTISEVLGHSTKAVIASHSGCRAINRHPRNLTDMQIAQIAGTGGVICVPFAKKFVGTMAGVAKHIDHILGVTGSADHVGIGSDLDGAVMVPDVHGAEDWSKVVVDELQRRGLDDEDIAKVAGGNLQRLFERGK